MQHPPPQPEQPQHEQIASAANAAAGNASTASAGKSTVTLRSTLIPSPPSRTFLRSTLTRRDVGGA
jgi:hypothetical protein